jgi:hypothetical protein
MRPKRQLVENMLKGNEENLEDYLVRYRRIHALANKDVPIVLALDATMVTKTGLQEGPGKRENCFAFIALPLDHSLPDFLLRSMKHLTGHIDDPVRDAIASLTKVLEANHFVVTIIATDGDNGMSQIHVHHYMQYHNCPSLADAVKKVRGMQRFLSQWPVSDLLHLFKNARTRLALCKGHLAMYAGSKGFTREDMSRYAGEDSPFSRTLPLEGLKDDLAFQAFTMKNLMKALENDDIEAAFFMLPFVCLNLAVRCPTVTIETRRELLDCAYRCFKSYLDTYPATGVAAGITEIENQKCDKKTLWTKNMCVRACNLCVGLYWACDLWTEDGCAYPLALGRIGSHSCECHFGMTRSMLRGDTRYQQFFWAQVRAVLVKTIMTTHHLDPYIRRFKNEAGCTLEQGVGAQVGIRVSPGLTAIADRTAFAVKVKYRLGRERKPGPRKEDDPLFHAKSWIADLSRLIHNLHTDLLAAGYVEKVRMSSSTSGASIVSRIMKPFGKEKATLLKLADE